MSYENCIVFLLAKAYQKSQHQLKQRLKPYGLTAVQALVLEALMEEDGLTAGDIGKRLVLDNATVSGVLDRMTDNGWINKKIDTEDKRVLRIHLAEKALQFKERLIRERDRANDEIMADFSLDERIFLKRLLRDLIKP